MQADNISLQQTPANTVITSSVKGFESRVEIESQVESPIGHHSNALDANTWKGKLAPAGVERLGSFVNSRKDILRDGNSRSNITHTVPQAQRKEKPSRDGSAQHPETKLPENREGIISQEKTSTLQVKIPNLITGNQNSTRSNNVSEDEGSQNSFNYVESNKAGKKKQGQWKRDARKRKEIALQENKIEGEIIVGRKRTSSPMDIDQVNPKSKTKISVVNHQNMGVVAALNQPQAQC